MPTAESNAASKSSAPTHLSSPVSVAVLVAAVALLVDQVAKEVALSALAHGPVDAPGLLSFRLVANRGVLLGFAAPAWVVLLGTLVFVVFAGRSLRYATTRTAIGAGLFVGGAAGNLFDRLVDRAGFPDGAVVDWIGWGRGLTFNLADVFLIVGLAVVWGATSSDDDPEESPPSDAASDAARDHAAGDDRPRHAPYDDG